MSTTPEEADGISRGYFDAGYEDAIAKIALTSEKLDSLPRSEKTFYLRGFNQGLKERGIQPVSLGANNDIIVNDPVKIPGHYTTGTIEVANFITDQELNYPRGNVVKYVARAGKKDPTKELEDLEKAAAYLQMAYNLAKGLPAVVRDPETKEVVWSLFQNAPALDKDKIFEKATEILTRTEVATPEEARKLLNDTDWSGANEVYEQPPPGH